jgi:hypothetical protein
MIRKIKIDDKRLDVFPGSRNFVLLWPSIPQYIPGFFEEIELPTLGKWNGSYWCVFSRESDELVQARTAFSEWTPLHDLASVRPFEEYIPEAEPQRLLKFWRWLTRKTTQRSSVKVLSPEQYEDKKLEAVNSLRALSKMPPLAKLYHRQY